MTFQKWAWDLFESTGNLEAFLAMKEAEQQENKRTFGKMELGDLEIGNRSLFQSSNVSNSEMSRKDSH